MRKYLFFVVFLLSAHAKAQPLQRPKLVVGIVVDQMRWDYLYRYYDRYAANGGFKRLLNKGFSCENTLIPYTPTITACGHSSIYTGSVPAINGITGNFWWDNEQMRSVYCTEDKSVKTVGTNSVLGLMSPRNLLVTTIGDELRLATNFKAKVIGVALKDRGGILPAGHSANAAYWYDNTIGDWISSTYYMTDLPGWAKDFNSKKIVDKYYEQGWNLLYPANTYMQSTADEKAYEGKLFGNGFPYDLKKFIGKSYVSVNSTPFGNDMTAEFAKSAILNEKMGADNVTDMIAISFSSPDYIGHAFGPNSIEAEDGFLRLDKTLGDLFDFLDKNVGKDQYTVFLSADHGAVQVPEFLQENNIPAGRVYLSKVIPLLNAAIKSRYNISPLVVASDNYQLYFDHRLIDSAKLQTSDIAKWVSEWTAKQDGILRAFPVAELNEVPLPEPIRKMINNGYYPKRNGDVQIMLKPQYIDAYSPTGTTHGLWNPYDSHIPLLWYGWGIKAGKTNRETYMTDIAATVAAILHIQMPSGCIGHVIPEVMK
jgi:predicted AlkP superfamily pyrophosphatase or phosphodiesterase